ncbi:MAG: hypothetical protein HC825_08140 [Oscillatoriales cyanobacterium RM1_1_9]|nr:hypothetical protein [Oscillatoriales cyanobacterium RM1_1_9]
MIDFTSLSESLIPSCCPTALQNFHLESILQDICSHECQIDVTRSATDLAQLFERNPSAPGVILIDQGEFLGMLSRRRFLELLSRPFGRGLFLQRSLHVLYQFSQKDLLMFPGTALVLDAALEVIRRPASGFSEPVVVQFSDHDYSLDSYPGNPDCSCLHPQSRHQAPASSYPRPTDSNGKIGYPGSNAGWSRP